jgi:hypothetical protein
MSDDAFHLDDPNWKVCDAVVLCGVLHLLTHGVVASISLIKQARYYQDKFHVRLDDAEKVGKIRRAYVEVGACIVVVRCCA